jgi:hypothetical protein
MFNHIGLVSQSDKVPNWEVQIVAAAMQTQVARDFSPIWGIDGTVSAFDMLEDLPSGYWPMIIRDDIGFSGAAGIHLDQNKKPFGLVQVNNTWTLTTSHEILEILADSMGNRTRTALSIKEDQGMVEYLVEVCDPSEAEQFGYQINGVLVSDFYTPDYFLPNISGNVRYSFTGAIDEPRTILKDGYISWMDPATGKWWQQTWFGGAKPKFVELGKLDTSKKSPRTAIDEATLAKRKKPSCLFGVSEKSKMIVKRKNLFNTMNHANRKRANELNKIIAGMKKKSR